MLVIIFVCSDTSNSKSVDEPAAYIYCPTAPVVKPQTGSVGTVKQFITKVSGFGDTLTINEPALLVV